MYGHTVLDNGFEVVPITPGTKFPTLNDWRSLPKITHKLVSKWIANSHSRDGIGIRTKFTPFLDIDIQDIECRDDVVKFAEDLIGLAPVRVGAAPKLGMPFKSRTP